MPKSYIPNGNPRGRPKRVVSYKETRTPLEIVILKSDIIKLLETLKVENLSQAAEILGIPKTLPYRWKKEDPEWAKELALCDEVLADKLEVEMMEIVHDGKVINQAFYMSRLARLKVLRPNKYKEKVGIDISDSRVPDLLTELREAGKKKDKKVEDTTSKVVE